MLIRVGNSALRIGDPVRCAGHSVVTTHVQGSRLSGNAKVEATIAKAQAKAAADRGDDRAREL